MKRYEVDLRVVRRVAIEVDARNPQEAEAKARDEWRETGQGHVYLHDVKTLTITEVTR